MTISQYNYLNLPQQLNSYALNTNEINYLYNAAGIKLRKQTRIDFAVEKTMDYIGIFVYEDNELIYILTSEGRIMVDSNGIFEYQYFLKDHLGNTRVTFNETGDTIQDDAYYPFGMQMNGLCYETGEDYKNKYLYNGKELQDDFGLDWYDYGARFFDAQLGRFHTLDPLSEKYSFQSPFVYGANNPILLIDKNGEGPEDIITKLVITAVKVRTWIGGMVEYTKQTTTKSGTYKSMNVVEANQKGLSSQKAFSDVKQLIDPGVKAIDGRIGVGGEIKDEIGNTMVAGNIEIGTDGGKIGIEFAGNSAELSVDENGNTSGNVSLLGVTIAGDNPKDENNESISTPTKLVYGKLLFNKKEAKGNYNDSKESIESIKQSYSLFNSNKDEDNK